jgi:hypothetical protein
MKWFNTTMLTPLFAPETETGAAEPPEAGGGAPPPETPAGEGRSPGAERRSIREELQANFDAAREPEKPAVERGEKGRFKKRGEGEAGAEPGAEPGAAAAAGEAAPEAQPGEAAITPEAPPATGAPAAPAGWSKEAKAAWGELPEPVRAAVAKREADVQKGVDQLKAGYADIDRAIAPHDAAIRQHGHTRAQAIDQLFGWFRALASNPTQAFPALAKSFNLDLAQFGASAAPAVAPAAGANGAAAPAAGQPEAASPAMQQYIDGINAQMRAMQQQVEQRFGTLEQTFAQQNEAKTHEVLAAWAKDKPHFEEVRQTMSRLIASGEVPLKEGRVDLDGAYETAIWAVPGVREKVLADQAKAAEAKRLADAKARQAAVQAEADKARKAGVSVTGGAPGAAGPAVAQPKGKGKSVRESLMEARAEVEGR